MSFECLDSPRQAYYLCYWRSWLISSFQNIDAASANFIAVAAQHLDVSDTWCILYPYFRPLLKADVPEMDASSLLDVVSEPVSQKTMRETGSDCTNGLLSRSCRTQSLKQQDSGILQIQKALSGQQSLCPERQGRDQRRSTWFLRQNLFSRLQAMTCMRFHTPNPLFGQLTLRRSDRRYTQLLRQRGLQSKDDVKLSALKGYLAVQAAVIRE